MPTVKDEKRRPERRNASRRPVIWSGTLIVGEFEFPCRILDISLGGARVRLSLPLRRGSEVTLVIPRCGELPAIVSFHKGDRMGLNFAFPPGELKRRIGDDAIQILGLEHAALLD